MKVVCLLALVFRMVEDAPVVIGANREEAYARGGEPPQLLPGRLRAVGGRDPVAGGTWLGVNERGVLAAVTNRPKSQVPSQPRSRGLLTRDLLGCASARDAAELAARELGQDCYAGCNVLCVDSASAYLLHAGDRLEVQPLTPGLHVVTARDVNDLRDPRLAYARAWLSERRPDTALQAVAVLKELCRQQGTEAPPMCLRGPHGGTISSSIIALRIPIERSLYWHAQGPPDVTPYQDNSQLFQELASTHPRGG
jgi:uncharacterized protein with NRDE domain